MNPPEVDPLAFPLHGRQLIEASAGTGKTYTIAMLYLRLVLGHGTSLPPRDPPEILVVTFTKAATRELRDRIRLRLAEAAACFREETLPDPLLVALRDAYPAAAWPGCARRLQLAAEWMDEAAVDTIHGWCNRMLREHAFDSDSLFSQQLVPMQEALLEEAVRDYWRVFLAPLDAASAQNALTCWPDVAALLAGVRPLLSHAERIDATLEPAAAFVPDANALPMERVKKNWQKWLPELLAWFEEQAAVGALKGNLFPNDNWRKWLDALTAWACNPHRAVPELDATAWNRLTPDGMADALKKNRGRPLSHPALADLEQMRLQREALARRHPLVLGHAVRWIARRFASEKERLALMEFDDVLGRLAAVLGGANGARLAAVIRTQFPVAMIDEFQDTDPVQYRIFSLVYPEGTEGALILIGDPKQAIYSFRGADIHVYLAARRACKGRIHTLGTNYRSTTAMVEAVNALFGLSDDSFLHKSGEEDPIPFLPATARGRAERLLVEGREHNALTLWQLPPPPERPDGRPGVWTSSEALREMAGRCAHEIACLLESGRTGRAAFVSDDGESRPLRPADLAVLVHGRRHCLAMAEALMAHGVRSVYLSDKESVYRTPQAVELRHWLAACAMPEDPRLLKTALATGTLGASWEEIEALNRDEQALEAAMRRFHGYREAWRGRGVLPMLRGLLRDFRVAERLLGDTVPGGERILTNLLHLAELLQASIAAREGEQALIRYLDEQCLTDARDAEGEEARLIRLESDADLVRIVTVHKSKGLEYPLVFFPLAIGTRRNPTYPLIWRDEQGERHVAFDGGDGVAERVAKEWLREEMRKLYVALTRARFATWVGMAPPAALEHSALGRLLGRGGLVDLQGLDASIRVVEAPEEGGTVYQPPERLQPIGQARRSARVAREPWSIGSYSWLRTRTGTREAPETPVEEVFHEIDAVFEEEPCGQGQGPHAFPRGARAGTFLHELLGWMALRGFRNVAEDPAGLREMVERRCRMRGWEAWHETLCEWLGRIVTTPWGVSGAGPLRLSALTAWQTEMEFWLPARRVRADRLDRLIRAHVLPGQPRPSLGEKMLNGMLKGFMDLVLEHEGRHYVVDYKSNRLGAGDAAYVPQALETAMCHARYDLQGVIYQFALHRHLRERLPGYRFDTHMGGAICLFMRGFAAPGQGLITMRPPEGLFEELDAMFRGAPGGGGG
ncbi:MAG: exodeoxyribonuclease V subunit beta [Magnetococcales bacterium]|nr:exodeoxyribonuclease V subunit beta [Magnetococcales bacterium]